MLVQRDDTPGHPGDDRHESGQTRYAAPPYAAAAHGDQEQQENRQCGEINPDIA